MTVVSVSQGLYCHVKPSSSASSIQEEYEISQSMETFEANAVPENTQSQWVGEASVKGKSQALLSTAIINVDDTTGATDHMHVWITVYLYGSPLQS
jgi:hypothetical protein